MLALQRRYPEALAVLRALPLATYRSGPAPLGYVEARAGHRAEALALQRSLENRPRTRGMGLRNLVWIAVGLGDTTRALDLLEKAFRERSFFILLLASPVYDPLRGNPRFQTNRPRHRARYPDDTASGRLAVG